MSTPLAISCPNCGSGLKLKNDSFVGKKVPCPKCKKPFLVEAQGDDDYGASDDEEEVAPRPRAKSSASAKSGGGKKKSKSGTGTSTAMIAGGVLLGLTVVGGIIFGAMSLFGGGSDKTDVAAAPDGGAPVAAPKLGDAAKDVTSYPAMVIKAGDDAKQKIADLGAQHNSNVAAQMQEGAPSGHAATGAASPAGGDYAAQMQAQMKNMPAAPNAGSGHAAPGAAGPAGGDYAAQMQAQMKNMPAQPNSGDGAAGATNNEDYAAQMQAQMKNMPAQPNAGGGATNNADYAAQMQAQMKNNPGGGGAAPPGGMAPGGAGAPEAGADGKPAAKSRSRRRK